MAQEPSQYPATSRLFTHMSKVCGLNREFTTKMKSYSRYLNQMLMYLGPCLISPLGRPLTRHSQNNYRLLPYWHLQLPPGRRRMMGNGWHHRQKYETFYMAVCQNLVPLVNIKIAGKWMFIPLKMVLIGIDPCPYNNLCDWPKSSS